MLAAVLGCAVVGQLVAVGEAMLVVAVVLASAAAGAAFLVAAGDAAFLAGVGVAALVAAVAVPLPLVSRALVAEFEVVVAAFLFLKIVR